MYVLSPILPNLHNNARLLHYLMDVVNDYSSDNWFLRQAVKYVATYS